MAEETTLGFDLDATPVIATIDRLGKSSEAAAVSADKLADAGTRLARSADVAAQRTAAQVQEIVKLNAQLNALPPVPPRGASSVSAAAPDPDPGGRAAKSLHAIAEEARAATAAASGFSRAQQELIARADRLAIAANSVDVQNKKAVQSFLAEVAEARALAQQMGILNEVQARTARGVSEVSSHLVATTTQMRALKVETGAAAASQNVLGASTGVTRGGLNSLRSSVTSMAASLLGAVPGVTQFTSLLGTMAIGSGVMIGVMAGMAAIAFLWDKIGGAARKAKQEQDEAIESLRKAQRLTDAGPAGQAKLDANEGAKRVAELNAQIAAQRERAGRFAPGSEGRKVADAILADLEKQYAERASVVRRGAQDVRRVEEQSQAESAASRLAFNQKDTAARRTALALLAKDRAEYARLLKLPETPSNSAQIAQVASEIKQLDDALKGPKAKRDPDTRNLQADLRARESIAATEERRVASAQALAAAAEKGQAFYDREVRSQALQNELLETEKRIRESFLDVNGKLRAGTEAQMNAEIARARAAIQTRDALAQGTAASLDIGKAEDENAALRAKAAAYDLVGLAAKDATVEVEYARRMTEASAVTDEEKRKKLQELAGEWRRLKQTIAAKDEAADATKKAADEAQREMERRARDLHRSLSNAIEGALTDISNRKNPLIALAEGFKRAMIHALAEALTTKIEGKVADILGIETPANKQEKAAREMNVAADKMLRAGQRMNDSVPGDGLVGSTSDRKVLGIGVERWKQAMGIGASAYGGFQMGYGIGQSTGDRTTGALGGAASGALAGAAIAGPWGAAVGAIAGAAGGLLGASKAAEEARKRLEEAKKAWNNLRDSLTAEFNKDDEASAIAQINAKYDEARKVFAASDPLGALFNANETLAKLFDSGKDSAAAYAKELARLSVEQQERIAQIREEIAILRSRQKEDYQQRLDEATPGNDRAEAIAAFNRKEDREIEDLIRSFGPVIDANEAQTLAVAQAAIAAEKAAFALNGFATSVRNAPTGFKLDPHIQQSASGAPYPGTTPINALPMPVNPFVPPTSPLTPTLPPLSRTTMTGTTGASITLNNPTFNFPNIVDGKVAAKAFLAELDKTKNATGGLNATRGTALEVMPS